MQLRRLSSAYCAILFLFACSSSADRKYSADNLTLNSKLVTNNTLTEQPERQSLSRKIFLFAPELDKETCTATGGCDCCSYNVLFTTGIRSFS
jgi:hypothetical protein